MYQKVDGPIDVFNRIDNKIDMGHFIGSYYDECRLWSRMDAMRGVIVKDWSFNENDGTISGATWDSSGKFTHCLNFDGSDDYVDIPHSRSLNTSENVTVIVWVAPDTSSGFRTIGGKWNHNVNCSWKFAYNYTLNRLLWTLSSTGLNENNCYPATTINLEDGNWHLVVGMYDGSNMSIWADARLIGKCPYNLGIHNSIGSPLTIGARYVAGVRNEVFDGRIDEFQVYNRALTADEIRKRYEIGRN